MIEYKKLIINTLLIIIVILLCIILYLIYRKMYIIKYNDQYNNSIENFEITITQQPVNQTPLNTLLPTLDSSLGTIPTLDSSLGTIPTLDPSLDPASVPTKQQPQITLKSSDCVGISNQLNIDRDNIIKQCFNNSKCYYTNNGCVNKSLFSKLPLNINNNFKCEINPNNNNTYNLECANAENNNNNYLFNSISQSNVCALSDNNCNLIRMSPNSNPNNKLSTKSFINGIFQPILLNNSTVQALTNDFTNNSGTLFFSDINNTIMPAIYNVQENTHYLNYTKFSTSPHNNTLIASVQDNINNINANINTINNDNI